MYSAEPRHTPTDKAAKAPPAKPKSHIIRNPETTREKRYMLYISIKGRRTWLQSSSESWQLAAPKSTVRRWLNEMGVPDTGWVQKDAVLVLQENGADVGTIPYMSSARVWQPIKPV